MNKRMMSFILALAMVLALLPGGLAAKAYGATALLITAEGKEIQCTDIVVALTEIAAEHPGCTVRLMRNVEVPGGLELLTDDVTLDFYGNTMHSTDATAGLWIYGTNVTLTDTSEEQDGGISVLSAGGSAVFADTMEGNEPGSVTIEAGTYTGGYAVRAYNKATVTINGGTFNAVEERTLYNASGTMYIRGGTANTGSWSVLCVSDDSVKTVVSGGTFVGAGRFGQIETYGKPIDFYEHPAPIEFSVKNMTGSEQNAETVAIPPKGYELQVDGEVVDVVPDSAVCTFAKSDTVAIVVTAEGEKIRCTDFYAALNETAAEHPGCTVRMMQDVQRESSFWSGTNNITLDFNDCKVVDAGLWVCGENVTLTDTSEKQNGGVDARVGAIVVSEDLSSVTIEAGTYSGEYALSVIYPSASVTINGGTFIGQTSGIENQDGVLYLCGGTVTASDGAAVIALERAQKTVISSGTLSSEGQPGQVQYYGGVLDFSNHPDPSGIFVCNSSRVAQRVGESIRLPQDYVLQVGGEAVDVVEAGVVCTLAKSGTKPNLDTKEGAQIRIVGKQGLRFISSIEKDDAFDRVKEYGTLLIPSDDVSDLSEVQIGAVLGGHAVAKVPAVNKYAEDDTSVTFTAVITDIAVKNYTRSYLARAYAIMEDGSVVYGDSFTARSVYQVALSGLESESEPDANKEVFRQIIAVVQGSDHETSQS